MESMENNQGKDRLVVLIDNINALTPSPTERCIYRVHNGLREVNKKAYEPVLVSIGPYHRGNKKYQMMEEYKLRYLRHVVVGQQNNDDNNLDTVGSYGVYLSVMISMVEESRKCYAEHVKLDDDEFAEMLLLDACFVVEVIRELSDARSGEKLVGKLDWMVNALERDLMLFENQLPFFVILKMVDLIIGAAPPNNRELFIGLAKKIFSGIFKDMVGIVPQPQDFGGGNSIEHLLGMMHDFFPRNNLEKGNNKDYVKNKNKWRFIPSVLNLREAGVIFKKAEAGSMFDITFVKGVISIPNLRIGDTTECFLRNLIAYEQYKNGSGRFVTDSVVLLDSLINTSSDVEILYKSGIVDSWLGQDEDVSNLFNKIRSSVIISEHFHYASLCKKVNDYYNKKHNRRMAKLRRNYLNSPWAVISVGAASILLVLTVAQTVAAFLSI